MDSFSGGSWTMISSVPTHSNTSTPSNQDHPYLSHQLQQQQQQFQLQQKQNQFQQQSMLQQQQQHHQSLASHFHLLHMVENLADVVEHGTRDQQSDALVSDLNNRFDKCQHLLNSISGSISTKAVTVEDQKRKLEESEESSHPSDMRTFCTTPKY